MGYAYIPNFSYKFNYLGEKNQSDGLHGGVPINIWFGVKEWLDVGYSFSLVVTLHGKFLRESLLKPAIALQAHWGPYTFGAGISLSKSPQTWKFSPKAQLGPIEFIAGLSYYNIEELSFPVLSVWESIEGLPQDRENGDDTIFPVIGMSAPFIMTPFDIEIGFNQLCLGLVKGWRLYLCQTPGINVDCPDPDQLSDPEEVERCGQILNAMPDNFITDIYILNRPTKFTMVYFSLALSYPKQKNKAGVQILQRFIFHLVDTAKLCENLASEHILHGCFIFKIS